jgi:translation initiation factor eIF-2B subunit delta
LVGGNVIESLRFKVSAPGARPQGSSGEKLTHATDRAKDALRAGLGAPRLCYGAAPKFHDPRFKDPSGRLSNDAFTPHREPFPAPDPRPGPERLTMVDFAADRASGSSDVALAFLDELARWAAQDTSSTPAAFRQALFARLRAAQAAQPSLALIHQLAARALDVIETGIARGDSPADLRAHLALSCDAEREDLRKSREAVAAQAASLVTEREGWIATLSSSAAVRDAFLAAHRAGRKPRALIAEGRPRFEGRALAAALAAEGIPVWLVVDAALPLLLSQARMLWLGADAVTEQGVINKIGSFAAALAAREHSVPVYALAERRKFLPAKTGALRIVEMNPDEVWDAPAEGVRPRNVYFELVPMPLLRGVIVEDGALGGTEAAVTAQERALPDALAAEP